MSMKKPTCRGSYALGTACGYCERCNDERRRMEQGLPIKNDPQKPRVTNAQRIVALLKERNETTAAHIKIAQTSREKLPLEKVAELDLAQRIACKIAARADVAYSAALDEAADVGMEKWLLQEVEQ